MEWNKILIPICYCVTFRFFSIQIFNGDILNNCLMYYIIYCEVFILFVSILVMCLLIILYIIISYLNINNFFKFYSKHIELYIIYIYICHDYNI
jgi:hypothetical protein